MAHFKGVVYLSEEQFKELYTNGTLSTESGETITFDENTVYMTPDGEQIVSAQSSLGELSMTLSGSVLTSGESFSDHVHIMIEFDTDGVHYGADFVLHPYDGAICLVSYGFGTYEGTAYIDESGRVNITIPTGLLLTNFKGHYINL